MRVVAMIPARIGSTRFPRKMLATINGVPLIARTCKTICDTKLFDEVYVVTDSDDIEQAVGKTECKVLRSQREHDCGTDRIAEVANDVDADIIINVQGDEPFIEKEPLEKLLSLFNEEGVQAASLVEVIERSAISDPNKVKVIMNRNNYAVYFSRSPIPYKRNPESKPNYYKHIGIYAFRKEALLQFASWGVSPLEQVEQLECNRFIDNCMPIKMAITNHKTIAVDTPDDIYVAEAYLDKNNLD